MSNNKFDNLPKYFQAIFKNHKIFSAPYSKLSSCNYGIVDLLIENVKHKDKWHFILDSNVLVHLGKIFGSETPNEEQVRVLTAIGIAMSNGSLDIDYALYETATTNEKNFVPNNAFKNVMLLFAVLKNIDYITPLLDQYYATGLIDENIKNYFISESNNFENDIALWIKNNSRWLLPGGIKLYGDITIATMILYADAIKKNYSSNQSKNCIIFKSFIEFCIDNKIPYNTRGVFLASALCFGYRNSAIKKKKIKYDLNSNNTVNFKYIEMNNIVNMAFDFALCERYDFIKKKDKYAVLLTSDKDLQDLLLIGYTDCESNKSVSDFDYWSTYDLQIQNRVKDFKKISEDRKLNDDDIWKMVGQISGENLFSDFKSIILDLSKANKT